MTKVNGIFAALVRQHRRDRGWSQTYLAARMTDAGFAWHQSIVSRVEQGNRPVVLLPELVTLAGLLDIKATIVLDGPNTTVVLDERPRRQRRKT